MTIFWPLAKLRGILPLELTVAASGNDAAYKDTLNVQHALSGGMGNM